MQSPPQSNFGFASISTFLYLEAHIKNVHLLMWPPILWYSGLEKEKEDEMFM
jgi:hypothetical protein